MSLWKRYAVLALVALNLLALLWLGRVTLLSASARGGTGAAPESPQQLNLRSRAWQRGRQQQKQQQQLGGGAVVKEEWYWGPIDAAPQQPTGYIGGQQHEVCAWLQGGESPRGVVNDFIGGYVIHGLVTHHDWRVPFLAE